MLRFPISNPPIFMPFAVECYFDPTTEDAVRNIWQALADAKINSRMIDVGARPHISLTVADGNVSPKLINQLQEFTANRNKLQIQFGSLGIFINDLGVMFLAPRASVGLLNLHLEWCAAIAPFDLVVWDYYSAADWSPHCTLAVGLVPEQFGHAFAVCRSMQIPFQAEIQEIGVAKLQPLERVRSFALQ